MNYARFSRRTLLGAGALGMLAGCAADPQPDTHSIWHSITGGCGHR